jgi:small GTP-binding protein
MWSALISTWFHLLYLLGLHIKKATIVLIGLDNAGKTSLLYRLKTGSLHSFWPTQRPQQQEFVYGGLSINAWDVGGHQRVRGAWATYYVRCNAVVFMIDSADLARMDEAKVELQKTLLDKRAVNAPILVLANKTDLPTALSREELIGRLGLTDVIEYACCCLKERDS